MLLFLSFYWAKTPKRSFFVSILLSYLFLVFGAVSINLRLFGFKNNGECWWMDGLGIFFAFSPSVSEWMDEQVNEFTLNVLCRWSSRFRQVWLHCGNDGICTMAKWLAESMPIQCNRRNSIEPADERKQKLDDVVKQIRKWLCVDHKWLTGLFATFCASNV